MIYFSGRNSLGFQHDWLETYHRLYFVHKIFFMYTLYVRKLAQCFHSLNQHNLKKDLIVEITPAFSFELDDPDSTVIQKQ